MKPPESPKIRKRKITERGEARDSTGAVDLAGCATIAYTSEDSAHPIDALFDDSGGPDGTFWASERANVTEQIIVEFDRPRSISRLVYEVAEARVERTQEIRLAVSSDEGRTFRQVLVQEYSFSPRGATFQREEVRLGASDVTHLRFTVVPNKSGSGKATLTSVQLFS